MVRNAWLASYTCRFEIEHLSRQFHRVSTIALVTDFSLSFIDHDDTAQEHPEMGYRQGMHEIASYLLFVLELEYQQYPEHPLFNPILPICFALLEQTLEHLKTAYDASGGKSLQQMSIAILGKILQNNPTLYYHLTNNPNIPPPPIYCTRWVRLMFSREVVGYENVFKLWDVLFSYANVMQALEITSAGRILLISDALLLPENNTLDLLMNVPPLSDIKPLTETVEKLMDQKESDGPVQVQSFGSITNPATSLQQNNLEASGVENPLQNSLPQRLPVQQHQRQSPSSGNDSIFSFHNMRQSLGQKSESLRKKIINTTVEWKEAASKLDSSVPFDPLLAVTATIQQSNQMSASWSSGNEGQKHGLSQQQAQLQRGYGDLAAPALDTATPAASPTVPITPKQHQHEMWSKLLQQKIWTVQQFLLDLESKDNNGSVPRSVWEALADMDRMQRELLNYSRSSMGSGGSSY
jgi:TBC1 domain family protein 5